MSVLFFSVYFSSSIFTPPPLFSRPMSSTSAFSVNSLLQQLVRYLTKVVHFVTYGTFFSVMAFLFLAVKLYLYDSNVSFLQKNL